MAVTGYGFVLRLGLGIGGGGAGQSRWRLGFGGERLPPTCICSSTCRLPYPTAVRLSHRRSSSWTRRVAGRRRTASPTGAQTGCVHEKVEQLDGCIVMQRDNRQRRRQGMCMHVSNKQTNKLGARSCLKGRKSERGSMQDCRCTRGPIQPEPDLTQP